jgi:hypothetical protein
MIVNHYTSKEKLDLIRSEGYVRPESDPFLEIFRGGAFGIARGLQGISKRVRETCCNPSYIVGILEGTEESWFNEGLLELIFMKIRGTDCVGFPLKDRQNDSIYCIPLTITQIDGVFVRDASLWSPKSAGMDPLEWQLIGHIRREPKMRYIKSSVPLREYKREFKAPEVWIPFEMPLDEQRVCLAQSRSID